MQFQGVNFSIYVNSSILIKIEIGENLSSRIKTDINTFKLRIRTCNLSSLL